MATARIVSLPGATNPNSVTLFKNSGGNALYIPPNQAVAVASPYAGWGQVPASTGDTGDTTANAQFLWYLPATNPLLIASGETAYFYRRSTITFGALGGQTTITPTVSIVSDNAFLGRINLIPGGGGAVPSNLYDGIFTPGQGLYQTAPFTWQSPVAPTVTPVTLNAGETSLIVEFELEIMNYVASPLGNSQNPAGFEYSVLVPGLPTGSALVNSNNTNPVAPLP